MKMCFNKKVIAGLAVVGVGVLVFWPSTFGAALPLLVLAACPLSMLLMMWAMGMSRGRGEHRDDPPPADPAVDQRGQAPAPAMGDARDGELARLQAEVDQLRAEQAASQPRPVDSPPAYPPAAV